MSGGGKKAVFLPLNLNDQTEHDRQRKLIQRGKSVDHKDSPADRSRPQASTSKSDQQKTPTQDQQKDLIKQQKTEKEHQKKEQLKHEKEAQKAEKEAQKAEKEAQKAEHKAQKEQLKLEKEQQKNEKDQISASKNCFKSGLTAEKQSSPALKTQKSLDIATIKHQQSIDGSHKPQARNSVDLQYTRDLLEATDIHETSPYSSSSSLTKVKNKK